MSLLTLPTHTAFPSFLPAFLVLAEIQFSMIIQRFPQAANPLVKMGFYLLYVAESHTVAYTINSSKYAC